MVFGYVVNPGRYSQPRDAPPARVVILDGDVPLYTNFGREFKQLD